MNNDDLQYIFKKQLDANEKKLYFLLVERGFKLVERFDSTKLDQLLMLLDNFIYDGSVDDYGIMPRFIKEL